MKKHYENFRIWLGRYKYADKAAHFIAGLLITLLATLIFKDPWVCWGMSFIAASFKEVYDQRNTEQLGSWADWFATVAGGLLYVLFYFV